ncbi:MAG TPA: diguanylate cyclase, partial [Clostridiales bacterium]|nr:diguanylate cyclase [Clostridiales bacterium]
MKNNKKSRQSQYNTMFFTLKLLALFFCAAPIFQYFFKETSRNTLSNVNIMVLIISLLIFSFITFMWLIMDRNRNKFSPIIFCEIFVFLIFCVTSIMFSGMHESYYKFLFVFLVISYTIEMGIKTGVIIATIASAFLLTLDIIMYKESGVNPYFQTDIALCSMFVVIAWILGSYVRIANEHIVQLTDFANLDGLTDLYNHRYFQDCLKQKCEESLSKLKPLSLLIVDIDYFKVYNDIFGHQKGDVVLKQLADILRDNSRVTDIVCRYGGEEFVIILWNTSKEEALEIGENVRKDVELFYFDGQEMLSNNSLTVSVGVAEFYGEKDSADNLINRADSALYRAKFFRRNRVEQYVSVFDSTDLDTSLTSLKSLINVIHSRDSYTYNHVERVVLYCQMYADYYKIPENDR